MCIPDPIERIHHEDSRVWFRKRMADLRELALAIFNGKSDLSLDDCRLLDVCRVCYLPAIAPLTLNYGDEYAHTACLEKEKA